MRAASDELNVATSSISRQIAALEKELGMRLIEGGRRKIKLTEAGNAAFAYYREMQAHEEVFLSRVAELRSIRTGTINLAVGEAFISDAFSEVLQDFMRRYPGLTVRVKMSGTNDAVALVREDEAHFGLIFDVPKDPKGPRTPHAVAAVEGHRASQARAGRPQEREAGRSSNSTASACRKIRSASVRSCARPSMPKACSSSRA